MIGLMLNNATADNPPLTYIFINQLEVFMTNTILKTLILASFLGVIFSCLATVRTYPYELDCDVSIDHDNVEIDFIADAQ